MHNVYFKILNINKSEVLMDQLSRVLTHVNVIMVVNFIFDLWQERKSKLYCQSSCIGLFS